MLWLPSRLHPGQEELPLLCPLVHEIPSISSAPRLQAKACCPGSITSSPVAEVCGRSPQPRPLGPTTAIALDDSRPALPKTLSKCLALHQHSSQTLQHMFFFLLSKRSDISIPSVSCVSALRSWCAENRGKKRLLFSKLLITNRPAKLEPGNSGLVLQPLGLLIHYNRNGTKNK